MRRLVWVLLPAVLGSCNATAVGFGVEAIRPVHGWADGCMPVKISGHGFTNNMTVKIGANEITDISCDAAAGCDTGFQVFGTVPPAAADAIGTFQDLTVTSEGETSTVPLAYYYVACPGVVIDAVSPTEAVTAGATITINGCGLDAATLFAKVGDAPQVPLTGVCSTATASFAAPALPPLETGYALTLVNAAGDQIYPPACDTADTAASCVEAPILVY